MRTSVYLVPLKEKIVATQILQESHKTFDFFEDDQINVEQKTMTILGT